MSGKRIKFWPDIDMFVNELAEVFPTEKQNIKRFYGDMEKLYKNVISETPSYTTADETDPKEAFENIKKHPKH